MPGEKGSITPKFLLDLKDTCDTPGPCLCGAGENIRISEGWGGGSHPRNGSEDCRGPSGLETAQLVRGRARWGWGRGVVLVSKAAPFPNLLLPLRKPWGCTPPSVGKQGQLAGLSAACCADGRDKPSCPAAGPGGLCLPKAPIHLALIGSSPASFLDEPWAPGQPAQHLLCLCLRPFVFLSVPLLNPCLSPSLCLSGAVSLLLCVCLSISYSHL